MLASVGAPLFASAQQPTANTGARHEAQANPGVPYPADKVSSMLPATVWFQGKTAPLQLRNSSAVSLEDGQIVWTGLVDNSGYSSSVQERYQFYLVTEGPLRVGTSNLPAGAYGAGFVGDHYLLMDLGGHTLAEGPLQTDASLHRPRPLQLVADKPASVRLYLGRRWVLLEAGPTTQAQPK